MRPDSSSMAAPTLKLENGAWALRRTVSAARRRESMLFEGSVEFGQGDGDDWIRCGENPVPYLFTARCIVNPGSSGSGVDHPNVRDAELEVVVNARLHLYEAVVL